jgi:diguanylate cyclase (GGDEF)-like protein
MKKIRNFIFLFFVIFLLYINILLYLQDRVFIKEFYFIFIPLNIFLSLFIILDIIYNYQISRRIENLERENERQRLMISDYKLETTFLTTLTDIIETFGEDLTIDEVIEKIQEAIRNIFREETIVLSLFGDRYKLAIKGGEIEIPIELIEELTLKGKPVLVNNISSSPQYERLKNLGITSFIASGLYQKKNVIGVLGIFSLSNKKFTLRDLNLLRMVSAPISLMIENVELFEKTKLLSITDSLTQIYNRRHLEKIISELFTKSQINKSSFSVAMCDVDFFKFYNDMNGHLAGDYVLKTIAEILKKEIKGSDIVARYGGEEFIILFPDTTKENAVKICEKLRQKIKDFKFPNEESQPNGDLTISFGVASFPEDGITPEELIKKADMALYKAKELGKDRVISA